MKSVSVSDLKNRLSHYLRLVRRGETIRILDRALPIATIAAISPSVDAGDALVARLQREGIVSPPSRPKPYMDFLRKRPVPCKGDPVAILIDQRGDR